MPLKNEGEVVRFNKIVLFLGYYIFCSCFCSTNLPDISQAKMVEEKKHSKHELDRLKKSIKEHGFALSTPNGIVEAIDFLLTRSTLDSEGIINFLKSCKCDIDFSVRDDFGLNPLHIAVLQARYRALNVLLNVCSIDEIVEGRKDYIFYGSTALMIASKNNSLKCINILLDAGADVRLKNPQGKTAYDFISDAFFSQENPEEQDLVLQVMNRVLIYEGYYPSLECVICLEPLELGQSVVFGNCKHILGHQACVPSDRVKYCPICRAPRLRKDERSVIVNDYFLRKAHQANPSDESKK